MSDNQRRAIFRIVFLLSCFLPTGVVGYWICHPQTATGWERAIQAELGITTEIDSVVTPGPYVTILTGLKFRDPEGTLLFETVEARIEFGAIGGNGGAKGNRVVIPYKVNHLSSKGLDYLVKAIKDNVISKNMTHIPWIIEFEGETEIEQTMFADLQSTRIATDMSVTPLESVSSLNVSGLEIHLGPATLEKGTFAEANFYLAGQDVESNPSLEEESRANQTPVVCKLSKTELYGTVVELDTKGNALPCWLLADSAGILSPLGRNATFNGAVAIEKTSPVQQRLNIAGVFREVDLGRSGLVRPNARRDSQSLARIEVVQCAYDRDENTAWNVVLFTDQDSKFPRIQMRESDLFYNSKQINIAHAFEKTLLPLARNAANDSNLK